MWEREPPPEYLEQEPKHMDLHKPTDWAVRCREVMAERDKYRNALLWAFDRLSVDDMTKRERQQTMLGIGNVLTGKPSPATTYVPNEWDDSAKLDLQP